MASANLEHLHARGPMRVEDEDDELEDGGTDDCADEVEEAGQVYVDSVIDYGHHHRSNNASSSTGGGVAPSRTSELTLSFEGEVYVFPAVTHEKVRTLLGVSSFNSS